MGGGTIVIIFEEKDGRRRRSGRRGNRTKSKFLNIEISPKIIVIFEQDSQCFATGRKREEVRCRELFEYLHPNRRRNAKSTVNFHHTYK